jgi:hypothetical protein
MDGSPQQQEEGMRASKQPIYDAALLCSKYFEQHLKKTDSAGHNSRHVAIEELWRRFSQWAAYIGAFAVPKASLDARLVHHSQVRDMVLELLYMIQDNLTWGILTRNIGLNSCPIHPVRILSAALRKAVKGSLHNNIAMGFIG